MSIDPIGFEGGINFYSYVGNSPTHSIDPLGLSIVSPECALAMMELQEACGEKHYNAWKRADAYLDWCNKAWFYCWGGGLMQPKGGELDASECPTEEQCKKRFRRYGSFVRARISCIDSPDFQRFADLTKDCVYKAINAAIQCGAPK